MMKRIIIILCLIIIVGCKSKKSVGVTPPEKVKIEKLVLSEVNEGQRKLAYDAGKRILSACNTSRFKPFTESEATKEIIEKTTQERITKTCLKFRLKYGDFKDLNLVEVYWNHTDKATVFRYKALYEKKIANKELRVSVNKDNKISAIKSLDWNDTFVWK